MIYSDNATNFAGANNYLRELIEFLRKKETQHDINYHLNNEDVKWCFIPPRASLWGNLGDFRKRL